MTEAAKHTPGEWIREGLTIYALDESGTNNRFYRGHPMTPMDAKTLEALRASIAKWERNAEAKTPGQYKTGPEDCPLCKLFFWKNCSGCPVEERTGYMGCEDSPYEGAWAAYDHWKRGPRGSECRARAHAAARDEVAFLKSLLPGAEP